MTEELNEVPRTTPDFATEASDRLAELFPEVVADGKINLDTLKTILDIDVEDGRERFGLTWPGKREAIRAAQTATTATLMPDKENSVNWDTTQNVFIEGDNLEVLKVLQKHYYGQIKMIYIDPPYNTGNDFVYSDDYADSIGNYLELTGQTDEGGKLSTNSESSGRFHSNWLSMMYPRLKLARNLLADEGVVFVSIGTEELSGLLQLVSEIFGEQNLLPLFTRVTKKSSNNGQTFSPSTDYVVAAAKRIASVNPFYVPLTEKQVRSYNRTDSRGAYKEIGLYQAALKHGGSRYPIEAPDGQLIITPSGPWRWNEARFAQGLKDDDIVFKRSARSPLVNSETGEPSGWNVYTKLHLRDREKAGLLPKNYSEDFQNNIGSRELMNLEIPFDFPKPSTLIKFFTSIMGITDGLVVDLFAGSGTTAHAMMELNAEDGGTRRSISVQLPEPTEENSAARNAGFEVISDITRERIRRVGKKIIEERRSRLDTELGDADTGFRAYKLVDTNFSKWKADSGLSEDELVGLFSGLADSANDHARPEALLTEVLLKLGFSLTEKIETVEIAGLSVFSVANGLVMAYLDEHMQPTLDQLRALVAKEPERLVVLEDAFQGNDELKTNLVQECKTRSVDLWTA
ncbi:site-specific DNA-methyltransferase [Corynebacterium mucifaciens]|nr:site-specific DNA-methyltransferase [Corynebacterium mucifaciens]